MQLLWFFTQVDLEPVEAVPIAFDRNSDRPAPPDAARLRLYDGPHTVLEQARGGVRALTEARIECTIDGPVATLGPALSTLYGRALAAVLAYQGLAQIAEDVREGDLDGTEGLSVTIATEGGSRGTGTLIFPVTIDHTAPAANLLARGRRDILAAVEAALRGPLPQLVDTVLREQVHAAIAALLASELADVEVLRNAERPVDLTQGEDVVVVRDGAEQLGRPLTDATSRTLLVPIELFAPATSDGETGDAVSHLADRVRAVLAAHQDLGGLVEWCEEDDGDPDLDPGLEAAGPEFGLTLTYRVRFTTDQRDLSKRPVWAEAA